MKRILLINANRFKQPWPVIPFGLCCVAASLERENKIDVLDLCFSRNCVRDIQNRIQGFNPDIIGISIRNIDNSAGYNSLFLLDETKKEIIEPCKREFKGPIVIGGPAVGISGREMLNFFDLKYAIRGDGEACMAEFVRRIEGNKPLDGLEGLIIRADGKIIQDPPPFYVEDLDSLPFSRPHKYIDLRPYRRYDSPLQIQTKRGCGLKCAYCVYNAIEGHKYRLRSPESVADEIEELVKETGIDRIEFTDSVFNIPLEHAKDVLRALIKKGLKLRLRTLGLNPGAVDEELADLMKEAGFTDVDLGAESGSDVTLRSLGKNYTKADVLQAGKILHERNIPITWYLLVGAPDETEETLKETFDTISRAASSWDLINIGVGIRVYNGSPIAERMKKENLNCTTDNFLHPVAYEPENISLEKIKTLTKYASFRYANFYMYDEDETTPEFLLMFGTALLRLFRSKQLIWKMWILMRKLEMMLGIRKVMKMLYETIGR